MKRCVTLVGLLFLVVLILLATNLGVANKYSKINNCTYSTDQLLDSNTVVFGKYMIYYIHYSTLFNLRLLVTLMYCDLFPSHILNYSYCTFRYIFLQQCVLYEPSN